MCIHHWQTFSCKLTKLDLANLFVHLFFCLTQSDFIPPLTLRSPSFILYPLFYYFLPSFFTSNLFSPSSFLLFIPFLSLSPPCSLRRYRIRAGSSGDSELLNCLAQLMQSGITGSPTGRPLRSCSPHVGRSSPRLVSSVAIGVHPHHHPRSSSASPRSASSLQRSASSSPPSRPGPGRSRSPPSLSSGSSPPGGPNTRRGHLQMRHHLHHHSQRAKAGCGHGHSREGKCSSKLSR